MVTDQPHLVIDHPQWAGHNVTLITGPPGSGKSTLAASLHPRVIEVENYTHPELRVRLRAFGLDVHKTGRNAMANVAVVRGAPTIEERAHHEGMCRPARTIVLLVDAATCHQRVDARGRDDLGFQHRGIDEWWARYLREASSDMRTSRTW